jgi:hypothetical protein
MKKLLLSLFLFGFLISPSVFADDISNFPIEGISIGDSLLDYMTEEEIMSNKINYFSDERQYYVVGSGNLKLPFIRKIIYFVGHNFLFSHIIQQTVSYAYTFNRKV